MDHYPTTNRNDGLIHATIWLSPEYIMLSKVSHKRPQIIGFRLYEGKFTQKKISSYVGGAGREWREQLLTSAGFLFGVIYVQKLE